MEALGNFPLCPSLNAAVGTLPSKKNKNIKTSRASVGPLWLRDLPEKPEAYCWTVSNKIAILTFFTHRSDEGSWKNQGPDLQNISRRCYEYLTIIPKLRSTYDGRLICKTSYKESKAFHKYDSLAK